MIKSTTGIYLPCFVIIISVPTLLKDFQRSVFSRAILMQPCWYDSAAGGARGMLRFSLESAGKTHENRSAKSDAFIKHITGLLQYIAKVNRYIRSRKNLFSQNMQNLRHLHPKMNKSYSPVSHFMYVLMQHS